MNYIIDAVTTNYWNFKGRSSRKSYWMLALTAISLQAVSLIGSSLAASGDTTASIVSLPINLFVVVVGFFLVIPTIASAIRRCHDVNYSYWYILIPLFNVYLIALMMFARGTVGANNYGEDPTDTPNGITNPDAVATPITPLAATPQN